MRKITKLTEPKEFSDWKSSYPAATYKDLGHDKLFPGAQTARWELRKSLLSEQKGLCCYCETRIDSGDFHVEHFRPKDPAYFPHLQLDYGNLHACCRKSPCGGEEEYCGHKKGNNFHNDLVSPLEPDCASHFAYDLDGGIKGTDHRGEISVSLLNLDSVLLRRSRKGLIEEFEDIEDSDFEKEITLHLDSTSDPMGEFYSAIEFLYNSGLLR